MKKLLTFIIMAVFSCMVVSAQDAPPQAFSLKANIVNKSGAAVASKTVSLRISILESSTSGNIAYQEKFRPTTTEYGQVDVLIGKGTVVSGNFSTIEWSDGEFFIKIEVDVKGGSDYQLLSVTQLLSVPYAMYAGKAGNSFSGNYYDLINAPTKLSQFTNDAGFLKNEFDPIFLLHPSSTITGSNITNWNNAFNWGNHSTVGYALANSVYSKTDLQTGGSSQVHWNNLTNKPVFSNVAVSGKYDDLANLPTIPNSLSQLTPDAGNRGITNLANPVNNQDAATKAYADNLMNQHLQQGTGVPDGQFYYRDMDHDNFGDKYFPVWIPSGITTPANFVQNPDDCNDNNASINPQANEICDQIDNNCNGIIDEGCVSIDQDDDGYTVSHGDCNDNDPNINPGAIEVCGDNIDQDCNGADLPCTPACPLGMIECNGKCVDLKTDGLNCGQCGMVCPPGYDCNNGMCELDCPVGYTKCNGECIPANSEDIPGDGIDQNCDGIDGNESLSVFVSINGIDSNEGTKAAPVKTIMQAISRASDSNKNYVLISKGIYIERVTISNGISLYGGYDSSSNWSWNTSNIVTITGIETPDRVSTVEAFDISQTTILDRIEFVTPDAWSKASDMKGKSSYSMICSKSPGIVIQNCKFIAGNASSGTSGDSGNIGTNGQNGSQGGAGSCDESLIVMGGNPGNSSCSTSGGKGGSGGSGDVYGTNGYSSTDNTLGGIAGQSGDPGHSGTSGQNGAFGPNGTNGSGGINGTILGNLFSGDNGENGTNGGNGKSGGGGGGGGGQTGLFVNDGTGNGGGGGGSGGCGGSGGKGGTAGGGSIGILVVQSPGMKILSSFIVSKNGGYGGDGGNGGFGGAGGNGGFGGNECTSEVGAGGNGGNGGHGGIGGHGGGGAGGPSIGILINDSAITNSENTFSIGTPGHGGGSSGNNGTTGQSGAIITTP